MAVPELIFMKLTPARQRFVNTSNTEFREDRTNSSVIDTGSHGNTRAISPHKAFFLFVNNAGKEK